MAIYARLYDETNDDRREDIQATSAYVKSLFFMSTGRPVRMSRMGLECSEGGL